MVFCVASFAKIILLKFTHVCFFFLLTSISLYGYTKLVYPFTCKRTFKVISRFGWLWLKLLSLYMDTVLISLSKLLLFLLAKSCPALCDPMDCSMPSCPVLHHLLQLAQTHVPWVGDAIQPSRPLLSPSPAFSLSQHQSFLMSRLFASSGQSIGASEY